MPDPDQDLRPVCFMVMPFRRKKVEGPGGADAPAELDCDALWDKAFRPAIAELGYLPIRADYDPGTVIVKDMLERLALADLVVADVSLPNGNVYYEVGLRHVARETACVCLAATWSRQLFDIDQFTAIRYPLSDGNVPDPEAEAIRRLLVEKIPLLKDSKTPYHELISGPEDEIKRKGVFRDYASRLSAFQAEVREARLLEGDDHRNRVLELQEKFTGRALEISDVVIELLYLIRDGVGWQEALDFIDELPPPTRRLPVVREQRALAVAEVGEPEKAIAALEELIAEQGDTPEREGLIGGRYKRLWRAAREEREAGGKERPALKERRFLDKAIEHYTRGMELDFNQYYCSSNVPGLLRARGKDGDAARADVIDHFVVAACSRALARGEGDEWLRPTLLGAAFRAGDVDKALELAERVAVEGGARWKLASTLSDLRDLIAQTEDGEVREALEEIYAELEELAGGD